VEDGSAITLGIRPEQLLAINRPFQMTVETFEVLGSQTIIHAVLASGENFTAALPGIQGTKPGDRLQIGCNEAFVHLLDEKGIAVGASANWQSANLA
jgi:ABC-type sugar transport system ATPase subunit